MRLPVKFLPRQGQHIGNAVGGAAIILVGLMFLASYLPDRAAEQHLTFGQWLGASGVRLPFLLIIVAFLLFGLAALTVALLNLFGGSPFNHLVVDRFGIHVRSFFGERRYSWKELGPVRPLRLSVMRAYGLDRRYWIVSDTFSGESRNDARRSLSSFNLRIPVTAYLGSSWLGGNVGSATESMAAWLESLRQLAHAEALDPGNVPDAPEELGPALPVAKPGEVAAATAAAAQAKAEDLPPMEDRKFGRRSGPTVER